jgi:hypothetical protein
VRRMLPLALVAPALFSVVSAVPAHAACEPGPLRTSLRDGDLVVTGRVTAVEQRPRSQIYTVTVKRVYAGESAAQLEVLAPLAARPCALKVAEGEDWLFVSQGDAARPIVRADWGSTELTAEAATVVADVLGSGTRPSTKPGAPAEVTLARVDDRKSFGYWQVALPGAVLAGGGFLVLLLARALGRSKNR